MKKFLSIILPRVDPQLQYHPFTPPVPPLNVKLRLQKLGTVPNYFFLLFLTQYLAVNYSFEFLSLVALYFYQYN